LNDLDSLEKNTEGLSDVEKVRTTLREFQNRVGPAETSKEVFMKLAKVPKLESPE